MKKPQVEKTEVPQWLQCRVYVAGPYSRNPEYYTALAAEIGKNFMKAGIFAFVPHMATGHKAWTDVLHYEDFMKLDFDIITNWADCLFKIDDSPGADREEALAKELGIPVFRNQLELIRWAQTRVRD